ncbi:hypothetical protein [Defluviimonas salinarum]|uniref:Uncharacterized protein n=1 Tax=Defluviimonas salinarum TaxID=2992147 RepID=A0ABT3IXK8_9RHOB|nr:hypothetical protein [Defluviimonas salinarum]MCW3780172.1 hypothetical protein [Defluviimonas salinarum]
MIATTMPSIEWRSIAVYHGTAAGEAFFRVNATTGARLDDEAINGMPMISASRTAGIPK